VWAGLSLLALCLVLWVVGGFVARRTPRKSRRGEAAAPAAGRGPAPAAVAGRSQRAPARSTPAAGQDDDMAEIEALLKSRGIE